MSDKAKSQHDDKTNSWRFPRAFLYEIDATPEAITQGMKTLAYDVNGKKRVVTVVPYEDKTGYTFEITEYVYKGKDQWPTGVEARGRVLQQGTISLIKGTAQIEESQLYSALGGPIFIDALLGLMVILTHKPLDKGTLALLLLFNIAMILTLYAFKQTLIKRDVFIQSLSVLFEPLNTQSHPSLDATTEDRPDAPHLVTEAAGQEIHHE